MPSPHRELAEAFLRLARVTAAAEMPVLRAHGLEMWDYVVLGGLAEGPSQTQARLADTVGRDRTRLIPILDRLEARGLVHRTPDPADRRNKVVRLSATGRDVLDACRAGIREVEAEQLADLEPDEREAFRRTLDRLADRLARPAGAPRPAAGG